MPSAQESTTRETTARETVAEIHELRLLPPLAFARLGSSPEPMDNFDAAAPDDPAAAGDWRRLVPAPTLRVEDGRIVAEETPDEVRFRDAEGRIRPVAPFLELWARFVADGPLRPLEAGHLDALGLGPPDVEWRVTVANLKAFRRTGDPDDRIVADVGPFSDHLEQPLEGECVNFKPGKTIPFGRVQYLEPGDGFPGVRLRFTPAAGRVFGPNAGDPNLADDVYDPARGGWEDHFDGAPGTPAPTSPGGIYRGRFNSQTGRLISEGYLDDACDGRVEVTLAHGGRTLRAQARITAGPPDFAPDVFHVRTLADELEQMLLGPEVAEVPWPEVVAIVRGALETVSLMETRVMNGTQGVGGVVANVNNMAGHDSGARGPDDRAFEPIFDPAIPNQTDPGAVRGFHRAVLEGLMRGDLPFFLDLLRRFDEAADLTDAARRKMPAMMRGSDGGHLALTRRQRAKVRAAAEERVTDRPDGGPVVGGTPEEDMIVLIGHFAAFADRHFHLSAGDGRVVGELFADPPELLAFLRAGEARGSLAGPELGRPLVVAGDPDASAFLRILRRVGHPMNRHFALPIPALGRTGLEVVERWILSLA